jgi:hypothetical protein
MFLFWHRAETGRCGKRRRKGIRAGIDAVLTAGVVA